MRATLPWLDELEPTPGARSDRRRLDRPRTRAWPGRGPRSTGGTARRPSRSGSAAETLDRLTVLARLATEPDPAARRALFESLAPVWRVVDGDGGDASPYRRLLRSSAARWAERRLADRGQRRRPRARRPGRSRGRSATILAAWRTVVGPARIEPWDYWYAVGAAARRLDPLRAGRPAARASTTRYLARSARIPASSGSRTTSSRGPAGRRSRSRSRSGWARWAADQPATGPGRRGRRGSSRRTRRAASATCSSCSTRAATRSTWPPIRTRPAFLEWPEASAAFLEGTADVLGWDVDEPAWQRRWLGEAAEPREARPRAATAR